MAVSTGFHQRWEVRPTLRLTSRLLDQAAVDSVIASLGGVATALRKHPSVAVAHVGLVSSAHSEDITATIALAQPSTPGAAVDEATHLLADACSAAGLTTDVIIEVVAEMAEFDPRSL